MINIFKILHPVLAINVWLQNYLQNYCIQEIEVT